MTVEVTASDKKRFDIYSNLKQIKRPQDDNLSKILRDMEVPEAKASIL